MGNASARATNLPEGPRCRVRQDVADARCGHGFVAYLTADGKKILHYAEFAGGIVLLMSVQVNDRGVYVAGYASEGSKPAKVPPRY